MIERQPTRAFAPRDESAQDDLGGRSHEMTYEEARALAAAGLGGPKVARIVAKGAPTPAVVEYATEAELVVDTVDALADSPSVRTLYTATREAMRAAAANGTHQRSA